jgi:hypothetical protein
MQNAKDTFYVTLRDRLAALNPARTLALRGLIRPATLVEENELPTAQQAVDTFCLRWTNVQSKQQGLIAMQCEIRYRTDGSVANGHMDRGRMLSSMDLELATAINASPQNTASRSFTPPPATVETGTNIFWTDVQFGPIEMENERLGRTAAVEVFTYQETGEL